MYLSIPWVSCTDTSHVGKSRRFAQVKITQKSSVLTSLIPKGSFEMIATRTEKNKTIHIGQRGHQLPGEAGSPGGSGGTS